VDGRALESAPGYELQADHDENQGPQVGQAVQAVGRDHVQLDQEREDADHDQDDRPEEAPVAASGGQPPGQTLTRRTISQMPSTIRTTGHTMFPLSQSRRSRLRSRK